MASLTKILATTMVALRLVDAGVLTLDGRIGDFISVPSDKATITIAEVLRHTGGFPAHRMLEQHPDRDPVEVILSLPLDAQPGTRVIYSCLGFIVLARVLERATGKPLDVLSRELVFQPLGMTHTCFNPLSGVRGMSLAAPKQPGDVAWATATTVGEAIVLPTEVDRGSGAPWWGVVHDENARHLGGVSGNAGLFSTVDDCGRFAQMLARRGRGFLSEELFERMVADGTTDLDVARGLGMSVYRESSEWSAGAELGREAFGHTGFTGTSLYVSPKLGVYAVLLTNRVHLGRDVSVMPDYRAEFHRAVAEATERLGEGMERTEWIEEGIDS